MSTFCGQIDEIPGISVDRFDELNLNSTAYFLSHCHTDHMRGLSVDFFSHLKRHNKYLYCSPISKAFLLGIYHGSPEDSIIEIEFTVPRIIEYKINTSDGKVEETSLSVTTSPAGHCPGSVMFIFEKDDKNILYTGDFRIIPEDLPKLNPLNDNINGKNRAKKFAAIYLDTTFLSLDYPSFPSRKESCDEICRAIENWLESHEKNIVILECSANYGVEYPLMEVSKRLNIKIHVKDRVYANYTRISELSECVTSDGSSTRIHACMPKFVKEKLDCRSDVFPENILTIVPSVLRWKGKSFNEITELDPKNNQRLYVCYSMHASYNELKAFIEYFKPDKIFPCVYWSKSQIEIDELLKQLTKYKIDSSEHDEACDNFQISVPVVKNISKPSFKSKYFSDDDDDDC